MAAADAQLAAELIARLDADQVAREALEGHFDADGVCRDRALADRLSQVDADNTAFMRDLLARRGWPTISEVGERAALAAWILCQHADRDPDVQREALARMTEAAAAEEAEPRLLAYLHDRVAVAEGRPQRYGTQVRWVDGAAVPLALEDPGNVDALRADVGLAPMDEYLAGFTDR